MKLKIKEDEFKIKGNESHESTTTGALAIGLCLTAVVVTMSKTITHEKIVKFPEIASIVAQKTYVYIFGFKFVVRIWSKWSEVCVELGK